jgi:hypothetical protein
MNLPKRKPPKVPLSLIQISWAKFEINSEGREEAKHMVCKNEDKFNKVIILSKHKLNENGFAKDAGKEING